MPGSRMSGKANREQFHTLGDLTIISVPAI